MTYFKNLTCQSMLLIAPLLVMGCTAEQGASKMPMGEDASQTASQLPYFEHVGQAVMRVAQESSKLGHCVILFNAERWKPYNRVQLTPLLASEAQLSNIYLPDTHYGPGSALMAYQW